MEKSYEKILNSIPAMWHDLLRLPNPIEVQRTPTIFIKRNTRMIDFLSATTKNFYDVFLSKFFESPTSEKFWLNKFPFLKFTSVYSAVHIPFLSPDVHCLNYRLAMNGIFTLEKLYKINKTDSPVCNLCGLQSENLIHMFVSCDSVQGLRCLLIEMLHNCLITSLNPPQVVIPDYTQLILLGWPMTKKKKDESFNFYWINFILGIARLTIYKTRQIKVFENKQIDCKRLFIHTLQKYTEYAYHYYSMSNNMELFEKYFQKNNPIILVTNTQIKILF